MAAEISALRALAAEQAAVIERTAERVAELERMLGMNSRNSGRPPSSDGLGKPRAAMRNPKGSRRPGGQPGHRGATLRRSSSPDAVEDRFPDACGGCGRALDPESSVRFASRQVHDLPEPSPLVVTEFRAVVSNIRSSAAGSFFPGSSACEVTVAPVQSGRVLFQAVASR